MVICPKYEYVLISPVSPVAHVIHIARFCFPQQATEYIPEKVKKAEKKLEENPYDLDAWSILIREAQV